MRYLVLSDIHANWEGLQAVLADAEGQYDRILNCGDLVGYGPDPNAVVEWCREHTPDVVRGNHDKACAGLDDLEWFNPIAKESALWTQQQLTADNLEFLRSLPQGPRAVDGFQLIHGSPADEDEYMIDTWEMRDIPEQMEHSLYFFGHTHIQGGFFVERRTIREIEYRNLQLDSKYRYLVNPGSVGQPRDSDPRAGYALYDSDAQTVSFRRVTYELLTTQMKIIKADLPEMLAARLGWGR